ncbi:hypothetical protein LINPERHAP2_LOCUS29581 [Linum perenne]
MGSNSGVDVEQLKMDDFIGSVQEQGVLDRSINQLMKERRPDKPIVVIESTYHFIGFTRAVLDDLHLQTMYNVINYDTAAVYLKRIEHNAACVGAPRLVKVCKEMIEACTRHDVIMSNILFNRVRFEFATLVQALTIILEMEHAIVQRMISKNQAPGA